MRTKILNLLDMNSRLAVSDIAAMLGEDADKVAAEIKAMEKEQIICGYHTMIDWDKTNEEKVTALIELKVTPQRGEGFDKIAERIYNYEEVSNLYLMSGGYDIAVMIEGRTMKEVALFVSSKLAPMDTVISTATHFVLKKYKEHGVRYVSQKKDERQVIMP